MQTKAASRPCAEATHLPAPRQPQTPEGFYSIKPARKEQTGKKKSRRASHLEAGNLIYWTNQRSGKLWPEAHIAVPERMAEDSRLLIWSENARGKTPIAESLYWRFLFNPNAERGFRFERAVFKRTQDEYDWDVSKVGRDVGYRMCKIGKSHFRIVVPIQFGMPLPLCANPRIITNCAVDGEGLNFSLCAVYAAAKGGAK